jgi:hypothetical protein
MLNPGLVQELTDARFLQSGGRRRCQTGLGVGRYCCELIKRGLEYETIAELARERFGGRTSVHCVRWYASKLRTGKLPA